MTRSTRPPCRPRVDELDHQGPRGRSGEGSPAAGSGIGRPSVGSPSILGVTDMVASSVVVTYYSVIVHRSSEPVNPPAPAAIPVRSGGLRAKLWGAVQAGLDGSVA